MIHKVLMTCETCQREFEVDTVSRFGLDAFRFRCGDCCVKHERAERASQARIRAKHSGAMTDDFLGVEFAGNDPALEVANKQAWNLARRYAEDGIPKNIWIFGQPGTGKTRLALCLVNERMSFGESGAFMKGSVIQNAARLWPEKRYPLISLYVGARNLILDDIDQAEWTPEGIGLLRDILDGRAARVMAGRHLRTLITANSEFKSFYARACLITPSASSMFDRMKPLMPLPMMGESLRGKIKTEKE